MIKKYIKDLKYIIENKKYEKITIVNEDNDLTIWGEVINELIKIYERNN